MHGTFENRTRDIEEKLQKTQEDKQDSSSTQLPTVTPYRLASLASRTFSLVHTHLSCYTAHRVLGTTWQQVGVGGWAPVSMSVQGHSSWRGVCLCTGARAVVACAGKTTELRGHQ